MGMKEWNGFHVQSCLAFFAKTPFSWGLWFCVAARFYGKAMVTQSQFRNYSPFESILHYGKVLLISNWIFVKLVYKCFWTGLNQFIPLCLVLLLEGTFYLIFCFGCDGVVCKLYNVCRHCFTVIHRFLILKGLICKGILVMIILYMCQEICVSNIYLSWERVSS